MNVVNLIGRLTKDIELRYSNGADPTAIAKFTVAIDDGYGEKKRTNYIPVTVFGKTAENCERFLAKGSQVGVVGKIQTGSYEKDGRTVYTTDVIAQAVEFIGSKQKDAHSEPQSRTAPHDEAEQMGFTRLQDNDIPF